jgi:serine protease Do
MRPSPLLLGTLAGTLAGAIAATSLCPSSAAAQDRDRERRDRGLVEIFENGWPRNLAWSNDADRAVLGISLGSGGRGDTLGVRVVDVVSGGPADKAGIEEGDRITSINGTSLRISREDAEDWEMGSLAHRRLQRSLDRLKPGDEVTLQLQRGREARTVRVKTVAADELPRESRSFATIVPGGSRLSLRGEDLRDSIRARMERRPALGLTVGGTGSRRDTLGLFVSSVTTDGPAEKAGIQEGDRVAAINNVDVRVPREDLEDGMAASARHNRFTRELSKVKPGDNVTLRVYSGGQTRTVTVRVGSAAEVFKDRDGFGFGMGDGARVFTIPGGAIAAPLLPSAPRAPRAPRTMVTPRVYRYDDASDAVRVRPRVETEILPRVGPRVAPIAPVRVAPTIRRIVTI